MLNSNGETTIKSLYILTLPYYKKLVTLQLDNRNLSKTPTKEWFEIITIGCSL